MRASRFLTVFFLACCLAPSQGIASAITGLHGTGSGAPGTADPHYWISQTPGNPCLTPCSAWVLSAGLFSAWAPGPGWIAPAAYASTEVDEHTGNYQFMTSFTWSGLAPALVTLTGQWAADAAIKQVMLNGIPTGLKLDNPGYATLAPFRLVGWANPGTNYLRFVVHNANARGSDPVGLRINFEAGGEVGGQVPEPGSLGLLGLGLAAMAAFRRRTWRTL